MDLELDGDAPATIAPEEGKVDTYRVTIADAPAPVWTIQLNSDPFGVREKQAYQLSSGARGRQTSLFHDMHDKHEPGRHGLSAGLYREVKLYHRLARVHVSVPRSDYRQERTAFL
ncbi:MAG: hypothetical protein U1D30_11595 [Planctomycetota bacterium]